MINTVTLDLFSCYVMQLLLGDCRALGMLPWRYYSEQLYLTSPRWKGNSISLHCTSRLFPPCPQTTPVLMKPALCFTSCGFKVWTENLFTASVSERRHSDLRWFVLVAALFYILFLKMEIFGMSCASVYAHFPTRQIWYL